MSLVGNFWKHFRSSRAQAKRARRLFIEPLEDRQLLAAVLTVTKTDSFNDQLIPVPAGTQILTYNIRVENDAAPDVSGANDATTITVLDDPLPAHTRDAQFTILEDSDGVASISVAPSNSDYRAIGAISKLVPGSHVTFAIQVAVDSDAYIATAPTHMLHNSVHVIDQSSDMADIIVNDDTPISTVSNLQLTIDDNVNHQANHGQTFQYTIQVVNSGPSDAQNTQLTFSALPALNPHVTFVSLDTSSAPGWTVQTTLTPGGKPDFVATNPQFSGGGAAAIAVFKLMVKVDDNSPTTDITGHVDVTVPPGDNTPSDNTADDQVHIIGLPSADLVVTKTTAQPDPITAGSNIAYTITVKNAGDLAATNVVLSDLIPPHTTFVSFTIPPASAADGWQETDTLQPGQTGTITLTNTTPTGLPANSPTDSFTLVVKVDPSATTDTQIINTASATTDATELDTTNNSQTVISTIRNDTDVSITKTDGIDQDPGVKAGQQVTYTIVVTNNGPGSIIATTEVQTVTVTGTAGTFQLTFGPNTTNPLPFNATAGQVQTELNNNLPPGASISVTQSGNTYTITFGGSLANENVAQITGTGAGGASVTTATVVGGSDGVSIADTFPTELTNISFTSTPSGGATGNTANSGANVTEIDDNVNMPAGSMVTYTVTGTVKSDTTSTQLVNTATATVPFGVNDTNTGNDTATDTDNITREADIGISISDAPFDPATPGSSITYTYTITNNGPSNSGPVEFDTTVPDHTKFVSLDFTGAPGWTPDAGNPAANAPPGSAVKATVPDMTAGAVAIIKMTVQADSTINVNTTTTNHASVIDTNGLDDVPANDSDDETTTIVPPNPDIVVTKNGPATAIAGNTITYTVTIANSGFASANNATLTDIVPTGTTFQSFTQTPATGVPTFTKVQQPSIGGTGTIKYSTPTLDVGKTATFTLIVKVDPSDTAAIMNTATGAVTGQTEIDNTNNSQSVTTTITAQNDVSVAKSDSPDPVIVGSNLTYTITVNNGGPSSANVTLNDILPANTTFVSINQPTGWTVTSPGVGNPGTITATRSSLPPSTPTIFTLVVKVDGSTPNNTDIANTATVSAANDTNPSNNSAITHTTALAQLDFGDAPASYGTLFADDGARHVILNGLHLGAGVDFEINGQPNATATGDDLGGIDDEDGVTLPGLFIAGRNAAVIVNASAVGKLDAWIDFGRDGHFDPTDRIANSLLVGPGNNTLHFTVPADAVTGGTFARFRISTAGGLGPTGSAADGEVEDYATSIITVQPGTVGVLPNPEAPGQSQLSIEGTAGKDTITVTQLRSFHLLLQVTMNGRNMGKFTMGNYQSIVVYAGSGDDTVTIKPGMQSFVHGEDGNDKLTTAGGFDELFGGAGNDTLNSGGGDDYLEGDDGNDALIAGSGNDVLLGGAGNDSLSGGAGRDILIGGLGADRLSGDAGDDILIGGATVYDNNRSAFDFFIFTWASNRDQFATRVNKLSPFFNPAGVVDDGTVDRLDGGLDKDHDWFIDFLAADQIVNFNAKYDRKN